MAKKKVCSNCKFYHDASCSHFWIEKPEQQTCDDFRPIKEVKSRERQTEIPHSRP